MTMNSKLWTVLIILCLYSTSSWAFVLAKRGHDNNNNNHGASQLAEALKVIQTQKRNLAEERNGYEGADWGYPWGVKESRDLTDSQGYGSDENFVNKPEFEDDVYGDYTNAETEALEKLLDYYYDLEPAESDKQEETEDNSIQEADNQEIEQLLDTKEEKEKKNIDWTPKALGFEGLKHKRTDVESGEPVMTSHDQVDVKKEDKKDMKETDLTEDEVKELLEDAKDTEVKAISKDIEVENVNGKESVSANEIVDILKDDGTGHKKEFIVENKVPVQTVDKDGLNKELLVEEVPENTGASIKHKRDGGNIALEEAGEEPTGPLEGDLLRDCLMKYIELEDQENTALAEALNWATKAQYDQTDAYIPMQVQYLRNAVKNEEVLVELRRKCFGLAEDVDEAGLDEQDEAEVNKRSDDESLEEPETGTDVGLFDPQALEEDEVQPGDESFLEEIPEEKDIYESLSKEEIADFIASELQKLLLQKGMRVGDDEYGGQWMDGSINDADAEPEQEKEYYINPFLRELLYKYRQNKYQLEKRSNEISDGICPAVLDYTDGCEYVESIGLELDDEALSLCNRHQLCYACGDGHNIGPTTCDKGFLGEAYTLCEEQDNTLECMAQTDRLFEIMLQSHQYIPYVREGCDSSCTLAYISGDD